jgi:hypothetical protein
VRRVLRNCDGQAAVELVAALPLVAVLALTAGQLLAAGAAHELAAHAAEAGAIGLLEGTDPQRAARAALPGWSRDRVQVAVSGRRVRVRVRPPRLLPGVAALLTATSEADAGPRP